jgi:hypothetical protein
MKRIKTFKLFEATDWQSIDWDAKSDEMKKLAAELNIMYEDFGYEFFIQERNPGIAEAAGIIMQENILFYGQKSRWPISGPAERSAPIKECLLRGMLDQFIFNGRLERDHEALKIQYKNQEFHFASNGYPLSIRFVRDAEDGKIKFIQHMRSVIQLGIPLTMSLEEFKNEFSIYLDSNITKMEKISTSENYITWNQVSDPDDIKLAEKIVQTVINFQTNRNALNVFLDGITNEKLGEVSIRMSDSLYERMQITQYLKSRGFSEHKIKEIQQARTDKKSGNELSVHKIEDDKKKLELLALDLCHEFINYGINFMPLHTLKESFSFQPKTPSIITQSVNAIYGSHMANVHGLTFFPGTEDKWILTRNPPLLRKLICELIFGLEETDSKSYELEFNHQYNHRYMRYQIMLSDEDDGKVELGKIEKHGQIIKIPENMPPDESVSQIKEVINENIKSVRGIDLKYETDDENDVNDDGDPMLYYTESALEKPWKIEVFGVIVDVVSAAPKQEIIDPTKYINEVIDRIKRNDIVYELINGMRHDTVNKIEPLIIKRKGIDMDEINLMARMRKRRKYT